MSNEKTEVKSPTRVITGTVRFSYLHVHQPVAIQEGQDPKFSASLIIPKTDVKTVNAFKSAIEHAKADGKDSKWGGKVPPNLKTPLRDGDAERPDDPAYKNSYFVNANNKSKPGLLVWNKVTKNQDTLLDQNDLYSGCYGVASVTLFPYNAKGTKGVACALNNILKTKDGDALGGGRVSAEADFATVEVDDDDDNPLG